MSDIADVHIVPVTLLIGTVMVAAPILILCRFKKKKKKDPVLPKAYSTGENSEPEFDDQKQINGDAIHAMQKEKDAKQNKSSHHSNPPMLEQLVAVDVMRKMGVPLLTEANNENDYLADTSLKKYKKRNDRRPVNYQIVGDLDATDTSFEFSLENTLAMESFDMSKEKRGLVLEGEETDRPMEKMPQESNSSDYSLFDSQSSRRDIREQRLRLLKLNTSVARRAAAALEDSISSLSSKKKQKKPTTEMIQQPLLHVEGTQDDLMGHVST